MTSTARIAAAALLLLSSLPVVAFGQDKPEPAASSVTSKTERLPKIDDAIAHAVHIVPLPEPEPVAEAAPVVQYGDPYGFTGILNQFRAAAGLHPLAYDSNLSAWASQNNVAQSSRGLGHHILPNCLQNSCWNVADALSAASMWMNSPAHRQNMLSPSATRFGIAYGPGPYWTLNAQ
jgi:uncharacterized protein YkwD